MRTNGLLLTTLGALLLAAGARGQNVDTVLLPPLAVEPFEEDLSAGAQPVFRWEPPTLRAGTQGHFKSSGASYVLSVNGPTPIGRQFPDKQHAWRCDQPLRPGDYTWTITAHGEVWLNLGGRVEHFRFELRSNEARFTVGAPDDGAAPQSAQPAGKPRRLRGFFELYTQAQDEQLRFLIQALDDDLVRAPAVGQAPAAFTIPLKFKDVTKDRAMRVMVKLPPALQEAELDTVRLDSELRFGRRVLDDAVVDFRLHQGAPDKHVVEWKNATAAREAGWTLSPATPVALDIRLGSLGEDDAKPDRKYRLELLLVVGSSAAVVDEFAQASQDKARRVRTLSARER